MKFFFFFLLVAFPVFNMTAQTRQPAKSVNVKKTLPDITFTGHVDKKAEWLKSTASHIPLKGREPYYDTVVKYTDNFTREDMDHNAVYYFKKMFGSKMLKLESEKHSYTGYGVYVFSADKRNAAPGMYKVYYTVDITVKGCKYYVDMHDFKMENQHAEVSFFNLLSSAKENDAKSKEILAMFHTNNEYEIHRIYDVMSSKSYLRQSTVSVW